MMENDRELQMDDNRREISGIGWLYTISLIVHVLGLLALSLLSQKNIIFPVEVSLVLSELTVLVPAVIYILVKKLDLSKDLGFRKIKTGSFFMCILLTFLVTPVASFVNVISQLFVSNTMVQNADSLLGGSNIIVLFLAGLYGPFCEEFLFRSILFNRYDRTSGTIRAAFLSALLFSITHLNVNQAAYAFVLGIIFAIVNKAAGSVYPSMIIHMCINLFNVLLLMAGSAAIKKVAGDIDIAAATEAARTSDYIYFLAGATLIPAIIGIAIAIPCVIWLSKHEGRYQEFAAAFSKDRFKDRIVSVSVIIGICFALFVMFGLEPLLGLLK